ncbi:hypothetical protein SAMN05428975_4265 [Mucilaginibacter sp. OK268]|nr:hypothetical protein SAMN05428975_4265 [Mucilaginibacter sp. OK268]
MLSTVEAWWVDLCALPFDGAQGDRPFFASLQKQNGLISFAYLTVCMSRFEELL